MGRVDEAAFSAAFGPLCFRGNPLWSVLAFAVWFILIGKEVQSIAPPRTTSYFTGCRSGLVEGHRHLVHYVRAASEPSLSILRRSAWKECVGIRSPHLSDAVGCFTCIERGVITRQISLLPGEGS